MKLYLHATLTLCLCFVANTYGQSAKLQGKLITETGKPVGNVQLAPINASPTTVKTNGKFVIHFPASVKAGDPTELKVSHNWVITVPYRGRFSTVHVSDSHSELVRVARKGSSSLIDPKQLAQLVLEAWRYRNLVVPTAQKNKELVVENKRLTVQLGLEQAVTAKLQEDLAVLSVYRQYAEETGFTLEALKQALDRWARSTDSSDSDLQKVAKAAYLGNSEEQSRLARIAVERSKSIIESHDRIIEESTERKREEVRNLIDGLYLESDGYRQRDQIVEALKPLTEIDELFATGKLSKEIFRTEWGRSRITLAIGQFMVAVHQVNPFVLPGDDVILLLSKSINNCREALLVINRETDAEKWALAQVMLANGLSISIFHTQANERTRTLSEAMAALDAAWPVVNAPSPPACKCPPETWSNLRMLMARAFAQIAHEVGGEEAGKIVARAGSVLDGIVMPSGDTPKRITVNMQLQLGIAHLALATIVGQPDFPRLKTAIKIFETSLAGFSKDELPNDWALAHSLIALSYLTLGRYAKENRANEHTLAIKAYEEAAGVPLQRIGQTEWVRHQSRLGRSLLLVAAHQPGNEAITRLTRAGQIFEEVVKVLVGSQGSPMLQAVAHIDLGVGLLALGPRLKKQESLVKLNAGARALQQAIALIDEKTFPEYWVQAHLNLGLLYTELGKHGGKDRQTNFEASLKALNQALRVYAEKGKGKEWALTQGTVGLALLAYGQTETNGTDKVRAALKAFDEAATVIKPNTPYEWANVQHDRSSALAVLGRLVRGTEGQNYLQQAISGYKEVLKINNEKSAPLEWALTQSNIGLAYFDLRHLSEVDRVANLHNAIESFRQALKLLDEKASPQEWAQAQRNLGRSLTSLAYDLTDDDPTAILEDAFEAFNLALRVHDEKESTLGWALIQGELGYAHLAWADRGLPDKAGHLQLSIDTFERALTGFDEKENPNEWAQTQSYLGRSLGSLGEVIEGPQGATNIFKAREAFEKALKVFTEKSYEWAQTKGYLARTLLLIGQHLSDDPKTMVAEALKNIDEALPVFSDPGFRIERSQLLIDRSGMLLAFSGLTQGDAKQLHLKAAMSASEEALKTIEFRRFPEEWAAATNNIADAQRDLGQPKAAAKLYADVVSRVPKDYRAIDGLNYLNHEVFFNYDEAFRQSEILAQAHPKVLGPKADLVEKYFTTRRFVDFQQQVAPLLENPNLDASSAAALRAIEIANLVALRELSSIDSRLKSLIDLLYAQPPGFEQRWVFKGVKNFISKNSQFDRHRVWLVKLFEAFEASPRDRIISELTKLRRPN